MRVRVAGYVHLGRMIDKCRAVLARTEGDYRYPCPLDEQFFHFTGIAPADFTAAVAAHQDDTALSEWVKARATSHSDLEREEWNRMMLSRGPRSPEKQAYFHQLREALDPARTEITSWADLQDLEEGRAGPCPSAPSTSRGKDDGDAQRSYPFD